MALPPTVRRASADRVRPDVRTTRRAGKIRPIVETPMKPLTPAHKNTVTLTAACLACLMFGLEISSVPVILPILETVLRSSFRDLQWIMNAYTIACAAVLMAAGALADRYGRKRAFLLCLVLFGLTSPACGLAGSSTWLIAGRFLQGMAGGAMLVCQLAVLSHQFADSAARARPSAPGAWSLASAWAWARSSAPASWRRPAGRGCSWCMFPSRWRPSAWRRPAWTNRATRNTAG